jgi:hypothetical protein
VARRLEVEIVGDSRSLERAFGRSSKAGSDFGRKIGTGLKIGIAALGGMAIAGGALGKKMIGLASDAAEVESKFKVVFGREMPRMVQEIDAFSRATGASRFELREQVADMGALLEPLSANKRAAGDLSIQFTKLATDLSSFNNVPVEDALLAIRSGLVGEAEPLRRFGVLLNEAAVKEEALRMGLVKGKEELTEQQKVQARANLIMKQTTLAQGDAERTSGSFANQVRRLQNGLRDMGTEIGKTLLPHMLTLVTWVNEHMPEIQAVIEGVFTGIATTIDTAVKSIKKVKDIFQTIWDKANEAWPAVAEIIGVSLGEIDKDLEVTRRGLGDFQVAHDSFWDKIKAKAQQMQAWYRGELAPGIENVLTAISLAWKHMGDEIVLIVKAMAIKIAGPIREMMNAAGAAIRTGLALLRGEWGKAWDQIRDEVVEKGGQILAKIRDLISKIKAPFASAGSWLRDAGAAIIGGLWAGVASAWGAFKSWFVSQASGLVGAVKDALFFWSSPPEAFGRKIIASLEKGLFDRATELANKLPAKMREPIVKSIDAMIAAVGEKQSAFGSAFDGLASAATAAFDKVSSEFETKTERKIRKQDEARADRDRRRALSEAGAGLAAAIEGGDSQAILDAQRQLAEAEFAIQRAADEKKAVQERKAYEQMRERQRFNLERRLAALQENFLQGELTTQQFTRRMVQILDKADIPLRNSAARLGLALAAGLKEAMSDARNAAKALAAEIINQLGNISVSVRVHVVRSDAPDSDGKRQHGGPVMVGGSYLVGERGPEMFRPLTSGRIIPNSRLASGGGGVNINVTVPGGFIGNPTELANRIGEVFDDYRRRNGTLPFTA